MTSSPQRALSALLISALMLSCGDPAQDLAPLPFTARVAIVNLAHEARHVALWPLDTVQIWEGRGEGGCDMLKRDPVLLVPIDSISTPAPLFSRSGHREHILLPGEALPVPNFMPPFDEFGGSSWSPRPSKCDAYLLRVEGVGQLIVFVDNSLPERTFYHHGSFPHDFPIAPQTIAITADYSATPAAARRAWQSGACAPTKQRRSQCPWDEVEALRIEPPGARYGWRQEGLDGLVSQPNLHATPACVHRQRPITHAHTIPHLMDGVRLRVEAVGRFEEQHTFVAFFTPSGEQYQLSLQHWPEEALALFEPASDQEVWFTIQERGDGYRSIDLTFRIERHQPGTATRHITLTARAVEPRFEFLEVDQRLYRLHAHARFEDDCRIIKTQYLASGEDAGPLQSERRAIPLELTFSSTRDLQEQWTLREGERKDLGDSWVYLAYAQQSLITAQGRFDERPTFIFTWTRHAPP